MLRVLITGATGFIGTQLVYNLCAAGYTVRAAVRCLPASRQADIEYFVCGNINADFDWDEGLNGVDAVVHLAGCVRNYKTAWDEKIAQQTNTSAAVNLAQFAERNSVRRFIYMSSIKVNGEDSGSSAFTADDIPAPESAYARSKLADEKALFTFSRSAGIQLVVIRPPLVYGPNAQGNFASLMSIIKRQLPLPFKLIKNSRSLVSVFNLCDLVRVCITHPAAAGEVFLVSDGQDVSTPQLIVLIAQAIHKRFMLFPFPVGLLRFIALLVGRHEMMRRLCVNLQVDIKKTCRLLKWKPVLSLVQGLERSVVSVPE